MNISISKKERAALIFLLPNLIDFGNAIDGTVEHFNDAADKLGRCFVALPDEEFFALLSFLSKIV